MTSDKPAAEVQINHDLIETLLSEFVPELKDETIEFHDAGWDNEIHRIGAAHAVRLPRREAAAKLIEHEQRWLPELAPTLPLPIPAPTHSGKPAFGFPWHWSIVPWLSGVPMAHAPQMQTNVLIDELSAFLNALHVPAPEDAPHNPYRGVALAERVTAVEERIDQIAPIVAAQGHDADAIRELWDELVGTPVWGGEPQWLHGDLHPLNLLVRGGRLSAVIDFGDITAGDPATDLSVAWMVFDDETDRSAFRKRLTIDGRSVDIHTWKRSRAWALAHAVSCMANSADDPTIRRIGSTTLANVLS